MPCLLLILLALSFAVAANAGDRVTGKTFATRSEVYAQHGMVATSHPLATRAGLDWDAKTKKLYGYNGSGRSPKALSLKWFVDNGYTKIPPTGPLPVSVPGAVDGWFALHGSASSR